MIDPVPADVVVRPVAGDPPVQRVSAARLPCRYLTPAASTFLGMLRDAARRRAASWPAAVADGPRVAARQA